MVLGIESLLRAAFDFTAAAAEAGKALLTREAAEASNTTAEDPDFPATTPIRPRNKISQSTDISPLPCAKPNSDKSSSASAPTRLPNKSFQASDVSPPPCTKPDSAKTSSAYITSREVRQKIYKRKHTRCKTDLKARDEKRRPKLDEKHRRAALAIQREYLHQAVKHSESGFIGLNQSSFKLGRREYLHKIGYDYVAYKPGRTLLIADRRGLVTVVLVPPSEEMTHLCSSVFDAMQSTSKKVKFPKGSSSAGHRRGKFNTQSLGISYGGGQKEPGYLKHSKKNREALEQLAAHPDMTRLAGHQSSIYRSWMPNLYRMYVNLWDQLKTWKPYIQQVFVNSVFSAATWNFGPVTVCNMHVDHLNFIIGGCVVTALGNFDYRNGGQIVLEQLKLIIEFPPGASIILPSACIRHGNLPVGKGERRSSFTQYTAGGLFCWVKYKFRSAKQFEEEDPEGKEAVDMERVKRWVEGHKLYSTLSDFVSK